MRLLNTPTRWHITTILFVAVLSVSTSAVLVRFALQASTQAGIGLSLVLAASRLCFASIIVAPALRDIHQTTHQRHALVYSAIAGLLLAAHFASWISSLSFTSIAASTTLVTTNPIWVALISWFWFGDRLSRRTIAGIVVTITGSLVISLTGSNALDGDHNPLLGNSLALIGSWSFSLYFLLGRVAQRQQLSLRHHTAIAYTVAAVTLVPLPLLLGHPYNSYPIEVYGYAALMAMIPQLIGHTSLNWSVNHVSPTIVTLVLLLEPIGASLLGYLAFKELPGYNVLIGAAIILLGVAIATLDGGQSAHEEKQEIN